MRSPRACAVAAAAALAAHGGLAAQDGADRGPVRIVVPAATAERVGGLLGEWFGAEAELGTEPLALPAPAAPRVLLLWDEWTLARAAAHGAEVLAVPFADEVVFAADATMLANARGEGAWSNIALAPDLHDRLGIAAPEVDGAVWCAAMLQAIARGDGEEAGLALWTTLDARAGQLCATHAAWLQGIDERRFRGALGPRAACTAAAERAGLGLAALPGPSVRRGIAVDAAAGDRERALAAALLAPERIRRLAAAAGLSLGEPGPVRIEPATAERWWQHFERHVRGRGRAVEELADRLDLVFGAAFVVCALLLWRALRRSPGDGPAEVPAP